MQRARQGDIVDVVACGRGVGSGLTPAGHASVNQRGIVRQQNVRAKTKPFHDARPKAFDQPVRRAHQFPHLRETFEAFEIRFKQFARTGERIARVRRPAGAMNNDDLCTLIGQHHAAERTGTNPGHFNDANA